MSSPEPPHVEPEPSKKPLMIPLNRDSLILIGAVAFLAIAILLAAVFGNTGSNTANNPTASTTAQTADVATINTPTNSESTEQAAPTKAPATSLPEPSAVPTAAPIAALPTPAAGYPVPAPPTPLIAANAVTITPPVFAPNIITPTIDPILQPTTALVPSVLAVSPTVAVPPEKAITPTIAEPPTPEPPPVQAPAPTPVLIANSANGPSPTPRPTSVPITLLRGTNYWTIAKSPYLIQRNVAIAPGAALIIEPGVEIRIAPGISISTEGKLYALGKPGQPVRFLGSAPQRWDGIFGRPGSEIIFEQTEIRGGGAGGTLLLVEGGTLGLRNVRISDNGGHIRSEMSNLEVRDSEISGNDMPYGAAVEATFSGGLATIVGNRIGGNRLTTGAPQVLIANQSDFEGLRVDIQRNLLIGQDGPDLTLSTTTTPLSGNVLCNALLNGSNGLSIRSETVQTPGFPLNIHDNAIDDHIPPIIPVYLKYGIGRGATSEVQIDMRNNWWGNNTGPYEPDRWADGRGDSVGENIAFDPWLKDWPSCTPRP